MPEHEARVRAFYDHEAEEPRTGRRRRQVADWGVGEDVFDRLPSRRFSRAESVHARRAAEPAAQSDAAWADAPPRPAADAEPRSPRADGDAPADDARPRSDLDAPARPPRSAAAPARPRAIPRGGVDDGRRTIVIGEPRDEDVAVAVDGRRTVVIGARRAHPSPRRPPRRAAERVGPRPDRIVAYAVALGVLLILIAILSAGH
jgi:hypothetical protein